MYSGWASRNHHVNLRANLLLAKQKFVVGCRSRPHLFDFLPSSVVQRTTGANGGAHRLTAHRSAVVAHVALHHEFEVGVHFRHAEGTRQYAVIAGDAARFTGCLHHAVRRSLDGVGWADLGARGSIAMHADHRHGLRRNGAIDEFEMNHRMPLVGIALAARFVARLAANAAIRIDEKEFLARFCHDSFPTVVVRAGEHIQAHPRRAECGRRTLCTRESSRSDPGRRSSIG